MYLKSCVLFQQRGLTAFFRASAPARSAGFAPGRAGYGSSRQALLVEDETQDIHQELGREKGGRAGLIVVRGNLDKVDADDLALFGQPLKQLKDFCAIKAQDRADA